VVDSQETDTPSWPTVLLGGKIEIALHCWYRTAEVRYVNGTNRDPRQHQSTRFQLAG
jgi:hypothetical protein